MPTIITVHMPRNDPAAPSQVCPGIGIHTIDIVQPPGIGIAPIADMDAHQRMGIAALAASTTADTPSKLTSRGCAAITMTAAPFVLVVPAPPHAGLVAALRCAIEPRIHAPETVQSARIGGVGVIDVAV